MKLEFHPIANIFPLLPDDELQTLADDIRLHGLREPITLYEGKILDGRNRYRACTLTGIRPKITQFTADSPTAFVISLNLKRRHLTPSQRAAVAVEVLPFFEKERRAKKVAAGKATGRGNKKVPVSELEYHPDSGGWIHPKTLKLYANDDLRIEWDVDEIGEKVGLKKGQPLKASDDVGKALSVSGAYVEEAKAIKAKAPESFAAILNGKKTISEVKREIRKAEVTKKVASLPSDKFRVLYADPPWSYGNSGVITESDNYGHVHRHYPSMTIAELCAMDVTCIAEDNAVLFLWVTSPLLAECWPVIRAWGFQYKTSFVWDKVKHNFGHYNSVRHEFLLVCTRGSCTPDVNKLFDSVISEEKTDKHSEKPETFREIIDTIYPHGKRIELFARKKAKGWETYGNEV